MCNNIGLGSRLTVTVNGQNKSQFNSLKEAQDAAKNHKGSESIVRNDDGSYSLHTITDNPNQEKQVIEMAKKGETSMFSPKVVEFSLQGTFYDTALKVENSVGEKDFLSEAGSEIRGAYLEASKTGKNEFASEEDAIAAAKLHSGIEAVVKGQDASGKPVYKLYRATQEDIDKLTNNPDYKGKISAFVVPTSISLPFMYTPFTFDNVIKIPVAPNKNSSTASAPVPAPEASQPTTPASPPATSPSTPTTPASSTETSPSVSETPVTPELSQETSTPSLNFPGLNLGSSTNRDFGLSLGTPSLSLGNDPLSFGNQPLSLTQPNILGPYSPFDPFGFGNFSFDPFFSDYMSIPTETPLSGANSAEPSSGSNLPPASGTSTEGTDSTTSAPSGKGFSYNDLPESTKQIWSSLSPEDQEAILFDSKLKYLSEKSANNYQGLDNSFDNSTSISDTTQASEMIKKIQEQQQNNSKVFNEKSSDIQGKATAGLKDNKEFFEAIKQTDIKVSDLRKEYREYATNPDGSTMTDDQLKTFIDEGLSKLERGENISNRQLLMIANLSEKTLKNNPNLSKEIKEKLEVIKSGGMALKVEMDAIAVVESQNIQAQNRLKDCLTELENQGHGNSSEAQQIRVQLAQLENQIEIIGNDSDATPPEKLAALEMQLAPIELTTPGLSEKLMSMLTEHNNLIVEYEKEIRETLKPVLQLRLTNCPINNMLALLNSGSDATLNKAIAAASNQVNSEIDAGFDTAANNEIRSRADSEIELANRLEESFAASDNIDSSSSNITTLLKKFREIITTLDIESYKVKKAVTSKVGIDRKFSETLKDNRSRWDQLDQAKEEYLTSFKKSSEVQKPMLTESEK